jgi:hypothetical protein
MARLVPRPRLANTSGMKEVAESGQLNGVLINRVLKDTQYVTRWIVTSIRQVLLSKELS